MEKLWSYSKGDGRHRRRRHVAFSTDRPISIAVEIIVSFCWRVPENNFTLSSLIQYFVLEQKCLKSCSGGKCFQYICTNFGEYILLLFQNNKRVIKKVKKKSNFTCFLPFPWELWVGMGTLYTSIRIEALFHLAQSVNPNDLFVEWSLESCRN